jgi:signal transduction histidine kinase
LNTTALAQDHRPDEGEATQPAPGLAQLDALISGTMQARLATRLHVTGTARPLPAAVDLAAYRIIRESLTNAIRHAGPATAAVTLDYGDADLRIEVADTDGGTPADSASATGGGGGTRSAASGHGLIGMRERAASVGGVVQAGPGAGGGFCRPALNAGPRAGALRRFTALPAPPRR